MRNLFASLALAAAFAPGALSAQSSAALSPESPAPVVAAAPATAPTAAPAASSTMIRSDVAGIRTNSDANAPLVVSTAAAGGLNQGEGVALMAVGGAGLVAGLLIGGNAGSAVAIGGLAVGLIGLYEFVR
ncbi:MAG: hypothetical protein ABI229_10905 [Gemmatimonadaceae bacterium]